MSIYDDEESSLAVDSAVAIAWRDTACASALLPSMTDDGDSFGMKEREREREREKEREGDDHLVR